MSKRNATDEPAAPAAQKSKKISKQEVDYQKNKLKKMSDFMQSVDDLLRKIKQKPSIYNSAMMAPLRQFCEYRDNHRSLFTGLIGEASSLSSHVQNKQHRRLNTQPVSGWVDLNLTLIYLLNFASN